jgi:hypothetical protein
VYKHPINALLLLLHLLLLLLLLQVSDAVVRVIEELEPTRQAIFEAQTAFGQARWNEHLAVDLRLAGEGLLLLLLGALLSSVQLYGPCACTV